MTFLPPAPSGAVGKKLLFVFFLTFGTRKFSSSLAGGELSECNYFFVIVSKSIFLFRSGVKKLNYIRNIAWLIKKVKRQVVSLSNNCWGPFGSLLRQAVLTMGAS